MIFLRLFSGVFLLIIGFSASASDLTTARALKLYKQLQQSPDQTVSLIVQFDSLNKNALNHAGKNIAQRFAYQLSLQKLQNQLLDRLNKLPQANRLISQNKQLRMFKYVPQMAIRVNQTQLQELLKEPGLTLYDNTPRRPALAQSVPRVYSSKNISPYHGNNEWVVAVLDTGINSNHSFLRNKVVSQACYSNSNPVAGLTSSLCPGGGSSSTAANSGQACSIDGCQHGTQVAGVVAGNGGSFDGVARDAKLISIQVATKFSGDNAENFCGFGVGECALIQPSDLIAGMERVLALKDSYKIAAVSISSASDELFSGSCDNQPEKMIIDALKQVNIAVIAASGNGGDSSKMGAPACISSAIAVAATQDNSDSPWSDNNISGELDLFAPGVNITSSLASGGFASASGTSFASAHVAGAWAVIRHASPNLSVDGVKNLLKSKGAAVTQHSISRRRLDIRSALEQLQPDDSQTNVGDVDITPILQLLMLD